MSSEINVDSHIVDEERQCDFEGKADATLSVYGGTFSDWINEGENGDASKTQCHYGEVENIPAVRTSCMASAADNMNALDQEEVHEHLVNNVKDEA
jgi:hypothetical protein